MEQFATFMGHTKETHRSYYRLPQDVYQTAKVSKLLMAINNGNAGKFKGKSLDEITLSDDEACLDDTEVQAPSIYDNNGNHVNEIEKILEPETDVKGRY
ncbi:hypothetical protein HUJ04_005429 [Dendroctonus ponderosae]|nr:hypothetical protein HUJ04_005429 [Dendroctonus ponderosae]